MEVFSLQSAQIPDATIDLFINEPFDFTAAYEKAVIAEINPGLEIFVVDMSTLIQMKRKSGRIKDMEDIEHLQMIQEESNDSKN